MAIGISIAITQNSQNVDNNTSNVTVKVNASWTYGSYNKLQKSGYLVIDGTKYTFTSSFNTGQSTSGSQTLFTKTVNVTHNTNGTKTLTCSASYTSGVSSGTVTASTSKTLTTIPRKSTLTVANGTLGTAQTLTVTRESSSFTHTITYSCGSASGTICTKSTDTSISFTPPLSLASQNTSGTSVSIKYTITTYSGSTNIGSNTYTKTCSIPASVKPSCSISVTDSKGYASTYGAYIKGLSKFKVVVTPTLSYGSAISKYRTTANGSTYTSASFTTDVLKSSGNLTISATVTDKRGRSATASSTATVLDYAAPTITKLTVNRCNEDGTKNDKGEYTIVTFNANITSLNKKNTASYSLEYKKTTETNFTSHSFEELNNVYAVTDQTFIFATDTGSSYDIRLNVNDSFSSVSKVTSVSTGFTLMHWLASGLGMAIGKVAELTNVFDIGFQTRFMGGILHPTLEAETDLNDVRTPNTYVGENVSTYNYANCPITSGTFTLEVVGGGEQGQVKQRIQTCSKTQSKAYERFYYQGAWGEWVCVSDYDGTLLWDGSTTSTGGWYMNASQTVTLSEKISKQKSGIVLVFSEYNEGSLNQSFHCHFIPKTIVTQHNGAGHCAPLSTSNLSYFATKYLYIHNDKITGHDNNVSTGTGNSGITYTNNRFVLRYVIGV